MAESLRPWSRWPAIARWLWLGGRPVCTIAAAITPWWFIDWPTALAVAITVLVIRPVTRWYAGIVLALAVTSVVPLSGLFVLARLLIGEGVLQALGRGRLGSGEGTARARGLTAVRGARHQLIVQVNAAGQMPADADAAWREVQERQARNLIQQGENESGHVFEFEDSLASYLMVAWCAADITLLVRAERRIVKGVVLGRWEGVDGLIPGEHDELLRWLPLAIVEALPRGLAVLTAAAGSWFLVDGDGLVAGPVTVPRGLVAALLGGYVTVLATERPPGRVGVVVVTAIGAIVLRGEALRVAVVGVGLSFVVWYLRRRIEAAMVVGPRPSRHRRSLSVRDTTLRLHGHWRASELALAAKRSGIAIDLLRELAAEATPSRPAVAAVAHARAAVLDLRRGHVQRAADGAEAAAVLLGDGTGRRRWRRAEALARTGIAQVRLELGQDPQDLLPQLDHLPARWPETQEARQVCIDAHIRAGRPEDALALVAKAHEGLRGARDMATAIDSQVAAAQAMVAMENHAGAKRYLVKEVLPRIEMLAQTAVNEDLPTHDLQARVIVSSGRASLLLGQIELEAGDADAALAAFEQAATRVRPTGAHILVTTALVLKGAALAGLQRWAEAVAAIEEGIDILERQRRQLTSGDARTQAIVSSERLYRAAFEALHAAQRAGGAERAGTVAAVLMEQLHQSSLASALRSAGSLDVAALVDDEASAEATRAGLEQAISLAFAEAYLPRKVDLDEIRVTCSRGDVLSYYYGAGDDGPTAYCVWLPPRGAPIIFVVQVDDPEARDLLAFLGAGDQAEPLCLRRPVLSAHAGMWSSLAHALIPPALLERLQAVDPAVPVHLVVVPDGPLARLPWPALLVGERRTLAEVAAVQLIHALELLNADPGAWQDEAPVIFHADPQLMDPEASETFIDEIATSAISPPRLTRHDTHDEIVAALSERSWAGIFFAAHGEGSGLDQLVRLGDGRLLSMSDSLTAGLLWPPWVFFGSCFVGTVEQRLGGEPLGLPIVCLLGGADTVIGGTVEVDDRHTNQLSRVALPALLAGIHPAHALRQGQLEMVATRVNGWAAHTCISRVAPQGAIPAPAPRTTHRTALKFAPAVPEGPIAPIDPPVPERPIAPIEPPVPERPIAPIEPPVPERPTAPIEPPHPRADTVPPAWPTATPARSRKQRHALRERWDWPRVKALLFGLGLGYYGLLLFRNVPSAFGDGGLVGLVILLLAGVCEFYAIRHLRRALDAAGAGERRRTQRRRDVDRGRNVAARSTAISPTDRPTYSTQLLEALAEAEAAAVGVVARQHVASAFAGLGLPTIAPDDGQSVVAEIPSADGVRILIVTEELAVCLDRAQALAHHYAMSRVERSHLATALAYSVKPDVDDARARLRRYFDDEFVGLDAVLEAGRPPTPTESVAQALARPVRPPPPSGPAARRHRLLRIAYLAGGALLVASTGQMLTDVPGRLADTRDLQRANEALALEHNEEAYRLFSAVAEREPDSITALHGQGCAAANAGDLNRWAVSEHNALLSGMNVRDVGSCLALEDTGKFHVVVVDRLAVIFPTALPPDQHSQIDAVLPVVRSDQQLVEVVVDASCAAAPADLPVYAAELAAVALRLAPYSMIEPTQVSDSLRSCVQDWPPSDARDAVSDWVAEP